ncbi:MAG: hypothetical protein U0R24_04245 [Solirubrobacterales bacterium]
MSADGKLGALVAGGFWTPGVNEAVCDPTVAPQRRRHTAPQQGCNCGFNAYFALRQEIRRHHRTLALGAIAAWGSMDVYADGFRAQYAQVIALAEPTRSVGEDSRVAFHRERLERAGVRYGVPVVSLGKLRETALAHASPVSEAVLPQRQKPAKQVPRSARSPCRRPAPASRRRPFQAPPVAVATWKRPVATGSGSAGTSR